MFRGSGPEPGPLLPEPLGPGPEPRASRYGSCTVRSRSRTLGGGSYDSRVLCKSRSVRFPGRAGGVAVRSRGVREPLRDLALRGREGQSVEEVAGGQLAVRGHAVDLPDRDPVQVRDAREQLDRALVLDGRGEVTALRLLVGALRGLVRGPPPDARALPKVAHRLLGHHASGLPSAHGVEEVLAELGGSLQDGVQRPRRAQRGGGRAAQDQGGEGGHGRSGHGHGIAPGTRCRRGGHCPALAGYTYGCSFGSRGLPITTSAKINISTFACIRHLINAQRKAHLLLN